VIFRVL